jgi:hypothetical protein
MKDLLSQDFEDGFERLEMHKYHEFLDAGAKVLTSPCHTIKVMQGDTLLQRW